MPKFTDFHTTTKTCKMWITPENEVVPLTTFHYQYFADHAISSRYGVPYGEEIPTRLAALRVGFVRLNYERNGGLLTIETMRWNRPLRNLVDQVILENEDSIDMARIHRMDMSGQLIQGGCVSLMDLRMVGKPINRVTLGSWNSLRTRTI